MAALCASRPVATLALVTTSLLGVWPTVLEAQRPDAASSPVELPAGPAKPGFDVSRFSSAGNGWFETFHVERTEPLRDVLSAGRVATDTRVLVTGTAAGPMALLTDQMAYHHIAQGRAGGADWLVTF
jgi:hypothetical protein